MEDNNISVKETLASYSTGNLKFLTRWKHKENGKINRVVPWWDCFSDLIDNPNAQSLGIDDDDWKDRKYAIGVLVQVGWLLENDDGVWLGVGPTAKDHFDDIGMEEEKKEEPRAQEEKEEKEGSNEC